jgi:hypothetical protein
MAGGAGARGARGRGGGAGGMLCAIHATRHTPPAPALLLLADLLLQLPAGALLYLVRSRYYGASGGGASSAGGSMAMPSIRQ